MNVCSKYVRTPFSTYCTSARTRSVAARVYVNVCSKYVHTYSLPYCNWSDAASCRWIYVVNMCTHTLLSSTYCTSTPTRSVAASCRWLYVVNMRKHTHINIVLYPLLHECRWLYVTNMCTHTLLHIARPRNFDAFLHVRRWMYVVKMCTHTRLHIAVCVHVRANSIGCCMRVDVYMKQSRCMSFYTCHFKCHFTRMNESCHKWYRVAKTHRMPYLHRLFCAKEPYN